MEFTFNGKSSLDFGLYASPTDELTPIRTDNKYIVPLRHGYVRTHDDIYTARRLDFDCVIKNSPTRELVREIAFWLSEESWLILGTEPDKRYRARLTNGTDITFENVTRQASKLRLIFDAEPFAIGARVNVSGLREVAIDYQGTAPTRPIFTITNNTDSIQFLNNIFALRSK
jgi:predicted phage tail component-like protein